jgi:hypothetical protein
MTPRDEWQVTERRAIPLVDVEDNDFAQRVERVMEQKDALGGDGIMAGGSYLCPVCHKPFSTSGGKREHIDQKHSEAAEIYHRLDDNRRIIHLQWMRVAVSSS